MVEYTPQTQPHQIRELDPDVRVPVPPVPPADAEQMASAWYLARWMMASAA
jgi:hypothetical protein